MQFCEVDTVDGGCFGFTGGFEVEVRGGSIAGGGDKGGRT